MTLNWEVDISQRLQRRAMTGKYLSILSEFARPNDDDDDDDDMI